MELRRAIAAFLTFAFATLLCAPAFAGVWAVAAGGAEKGCCCSKKEETRHVTVQEQNCSCPACACTVGDAAPLLPLQAVSEADLPGVAGVVHAQPLPLPLDNVVPSRELQVTAARGPPAGSQPPLYILYDTLLI